MKYIVQAIEIAVIILLVSMSVFTYEQVEQASIIKPNEEQIKTYHVAVVTDTTGSYASDQFFEGLTLGANDFDIVYELYDTADYDLETIFDIILVTHIDGVILKLDNNSVATEYALECKSKGIYIETIGNDDLESNRDLYIGTNKFNTGKVAASLVEKAIDRQGNVAVILGAEYQNTPNQEPNNFLSGIYDTANDNPLFNIVDIRYSDDQRAELIMDIFLKEQSHLKAVVCTDPTDAVRITRVLVDKNKIGSIKIIASGDTPEIRESILNDVIEASIVEDYDELGYLAMENLYSLLSGNGVSSYVSIPVKVIDKDVLLSPGGE